MEEELPTYEVEEISLEEAVEILAQAPLDDYLTNDSVILACPRWLLTDDLINSYSNRF